jgi:nitroreductase
LDAEWVGSTPEDRRLVFLSLEKALSPQWLVFLRHVAVNVRLHFFPLIAWSGVLCGLYYTFASRAYRREQRAVISGCLRNGRGYADEALFLKLRRNIHRIEKGLLFSPRRATFALDYIAETVALFEQALAADSGCCRRSETQWAADVLRTYFQAVTAVQVTKARERFERTAIRSGGEKIPQPRGLRSSPVSPPLFLELMRHRKSVRRFLPRPVPRELLDRAVEAAAQAPSSCNRQPFCFRFFDDPALVRTLARIPHGAKGFAEQIPVIGAVVGDLSAYQYERDRHGIYVDGALATMALLLALETLGLGACPLNWPEIASLEVQAARLLALPPHERIVIFLAIGYPDPEGLVAHSERKTLDQLRRYNLAANR